MVMSNKHMLNIIKNKLFSPKEVKLLISVLRVEREKIKISSNEIFGASNGLSLVNDELIEIISNSREKLYELIVIKRVDCRIVFYTLLKNYCRNLIVSGKHHTYRGRLSMSGTSLKSLYRYSVDELICSGAITKESADDEIRLEPDLKFG